MIFLPSRCSCPVIGSKIPVRGVKGLWGLCEQGGTYLVHRASQSNLILILPQGHSGGGGWSDGGGFSSCVGVSPRIRIQVPPHFQQPRQGNGWFFSSFKPMSHSVSLLILCIGQMRVWEETPLCHFVGLCSKSWGGGPHLTNSHGMAGYSTVSDSNLRLFTIRDSLSFELASHKEPTR